ncbi:MAG TPA: hypothetical protein VNH22_19660, partial [Blastocatellia bacterium]|nr:hypothetical protein [Blastocatellia bacterium]
MARKNFLLGDWEVLPIIPNGTATRNVITVAAHSGGDVDLVRITYKFTNDDLVVQHSINTNGHTAFDTLYFVLPFGANFIHFIGKVIYHRHGDTANEMITDMRGRKKTLNSRDLITLGDLIPDAVPLKGDQRSSGDVSGASGISSLLFRTEDGDWMA